jgi:poly-gamma-glutamate synthesis protein (capsule biosynthesis protein)
MSVRARAGPAAALAGMLAGLVVIVAGSIPGGGPPPLAATEPSAPASAPASPAPSPVPASPSPPPPPAELTVLGAGDVLIHPPVWEQAAADAEGSGYDFYPIFADLRPVISGADLAICHLETPLAPAGGPFQGFPTFSAPPQVATALARVGYDTCSTASNHTLDQGEAGVTRTIDALVAAGLGWAGSARSAADAATPVVREVALDDGQTVQVGHLSYTFGFNGLSPPRGKEWIANRIDADRIVAEAVAARAAGAEIVVLSVHWGTEYQVDPDGEQLNLADRLAGSGEIDLILGHHAHVVQPVEKIGDAWVVYGMGNQLARHADVIDGQREGALARVTFTERDSGWAVTAIEAVPTWVAMEPEIRLVDLPAALAGPAPAEPSREERVSYLAAYERITESLLRRGADQDGLVVLAADR